MKRYLNKEERTDVVVLGGFVSWLEEKIPQLSASHANIKEVRRKLKTAKTLAYQAMEAIMQPLDVQEAAKTVAESRKMKVVTKYRDEAMREFKDFQQADDVTALKTDDYLDIVELTIEGHCKTCRLTGDQAESCNVRRIFIETDIEPPDQYAPVGKCPYQY